MTYDQLTGKYARLRSELAAAYTPSTWSLSAGHIERIARELEAIERALGAGRLLCVPGRAASTVECARPE